MRLLRPSYLITLAAYLLLSAHPVHAHATPPWAKGYLILTDTTQVQRSAQFNMQGELATNVATTHFHVLASPSGLAQNHGNGFTVQLQDSLHNPVTSFSGEFWLTGGSYLGGGVPSPAAVPRPLDTAFNLECSDEAAGDADIIPYLNIYSMLTSGSVKPVFAGSGRGGFYATFGGDYFIVAGIDSVRSTDEDGDGDTDHDDIVLMRAALSSQDKRFDLNWSGAVDQADMDILTDEVLRTVGAGGGTCYDNGVDHVVYSAEDSYAYDTIPPSAPTCFKVQHSGLTHSLSWVAGGDDGTIGKAAYYGFVIQTTPITSLPGLFEELDSTPAPATSGTPQSFTWIASDSTTLLYFAVFAFDTYGNVSALVSTASTRSTSDVTPPRAVSNLSTEVVGVNRIWLRWKAAGDDDSLGTATQYDLRWSTSPITSGNFASATPLTTTCPVPGGFADSVLFTRDDCPGSVTYYFAIKTKDESTWSGISNVPSVGNVCDLSLMQPTTDGAATRAPDALQLSVARTSPGEVAFRISGGNARGGDVRLSVMDLFGRRVFDQRIHRASGGPELATWNLQNPGGGPLRSGVYFARLWAGDETRSLTVRVVH